MTKSNAESGLNPFLGKPEVDIIFQNRGAYGNYVYIDNLVVGGSLVNTEEEIIEQSLLVTPNPNHGEFRIQFDIPKGMQDGKMSITDPLGKSVYTSGNISASDRFDQAIKIDNLTLGLYYLSIENK
jgi:hypothetical protein